MFSEKCRLAIQELLYLSGKCIFLKDTQVFWSGPIFSYWHIIICSYFMFINYIASCHMRICTESEFCFHFHPCDPDSLHQAIDRMGRREISSLHQSFLYISLIIYTSPERMLKRVWEKEKICNSIHSTSRRDTVVI